MMTFYVYLLLDPLDFYIPFYVGKGSGKRKSTTLLTSSSSVFKKNKIDKIVRQGAIPTVMIWEDNLNERDAFDLEIQLIKRFGRRNNSTGILVNLTDGGEGTSGCPNTKIQKDKISKKLSGNGNPMFGKTHTDEARQKIRASKLGSHPNLSPETRKKFGENLARNKHRWSKSVYQIDNTGKIITLWESSASAAKSLGLLTTNICKVNKNNCRRQAGGYFWRLIDSEDIKLGKLDINELSNQKDNKSVRIRQIKDGVYIKTWNSISQIIDENSYVYSTFYKYICSGQLYDGYEWKFEYEVDYNEIKNTRNKRAAELARIYRIRKKLFDENR